MFLDTVVYKGTRFKEKSILDVKTHFKTTETFQYTHFTFCHSPSVKKRFVKEEALRILRTNSSKTTFEENISNFKKRLIDRGYPQTMIKNLLSDINFTERESALLKHNNKEEKNIAFRDTVPALSVYFKRSFTEKMESYTKTTVTSPNFLKNQEERKIPKGHARYS